MSGALPPGTEINSRYTLGDPLGKGQTAIVYKAWDDHLHRHVAIKLLEPTSGGPATWHESRTLEHLRSDYLLPVLNADIISETDIRYITTPIMANGDLEAAAKDVGVPASRAVAWGVQMAYALERVHSARLLHRDVKPGNVFINDDGAILLGDLGKAVAFTPGAPAPREGTWVTIAPETAPDDGHCTVASDGYSLAATVFYLLAGCYPVDQEQDPRTLQAEITAGNRRKLMDVAPHVSRSLRAIIEKAMSFDPDDRFSSALEFGNTLAGAALHARDWTRTLHPDHLLCLDGKAKGTSGPVSVCSVRTGTSVDIQARLASGRRPPGVADESVRPRELSKAMRALTAKLG